MPKFAFVAAVLAAMVVVPVFGKTPIANTQSVLLSPELARLKLTAPQKLVPATTFLVGVDSVPEMPDLNKIAPTDDAAEWEFLRYGVQGPTGLDALGEMLDIQETERPWSTTTTVHFLAKFGNPLVPFFSMAHEVDALDAFDRFGVGGGMLYQINEHAALTGEVLYFDDHSNYNETLSRETRMMARLEIDF